MYRSIVLVLAFMTFGAEAEWTHKNPKILSVYDGDTFKASFEIWPNHFAVSSVRILGFDSPEIRGKCAGEKDQAIKARELARSLLKEGVTVSVIGPDKYGGRVDAIVYINGRDMADIMIEAGMGRAYVGGKRKGWCSEKTAKK